jgi:NDP-sugar pyrophosphorylase family protein
MGDLTREIPKPMLDIEGRPLLAYLLGHLKAQGFTEIFINLHFRPDLITSRFGDGSAWGLRITYSLEPALLGTAGAVKNLEEKLGDESFLVQYGDILTDQDFHPLIRKREETRALATLLVHRRAGSNSVLGLSPHGMITAFLERPTEAERRTVASDWVNSGVCVCSREAIRHLVPGAPADFPRDVFRPLVGSGRLFASPLTGFRCAIDSPDRLRQAREAVASGRCRIQPLEVNRP